MEHIDAVITWVDGHQQAMKSQIHAYIQKEGLANSPNVIASRFEPSGEIEFCLASIFRNMPFVRNIYLVTSGTKPALSEHLKTQFPERLKNIRFIDHATIFKGFEKYLPVFNSRAIETMLWRIPGITEKFIYLNDDFFVLRQNSFSHWYRNGKFVLRGRWHFYPWYRILWHHVLTPAHKRRASFHLGMWNAAKIAGFAWRYFVFDHIPYLFSREVLETFYQQNPQVLLKNISYKFRHPEQYNPAALNFHLLLKQNMALISTKEELVYLQPSGRKKNYVQKKFQKAKKNEKWKFMCVQDLSISTLQQQKEVFEGLRDILQFPA